MIAWIKRVLKAIFGGPRSEQFSTNCNGNCLQGRRCDCKDSE